jgi:UDP-N-acetylglucosamine 2-epimerase (non-hydrolysing)
MKKIMVIFGTRPEAIKMAPVVMRLLEERETFQVKVLVTAQHRQMLDQVTELFGLAPDYDLDLMAPNQNLFDITGRALHGLKEPLERERPDLVMVHGDTTTTFAASLAAFYLHIKVGHVEAGLRTRDKYRPFPEEINRRLVGSLADYHFAPTAWARDNLLSEGVPAENIWVTGNTVIDALHAIVAKINREEKHWRNLLKQQYGLTLDGRRLILVTGHRRENFGPGFRSICLALKDLVEARNDIHLVYPVHLNPQVQEPVHNILLGNYEPALKASGACTVEVPGGGCLSLLPPLDYAPFVYLMSKSYLVLTDSGGIQEEAPAFGKPVLVMREVTERPEGVWANTVKLVGTDRHKISQEVGELLTDPNHYQAMVHAQNPYGGGHAAGRIVKILKEKFGENS